MHALGPRRDEFWFNPKHAQTWVDQKGKTGKQLNPFCHRLKALSFGVWDEHLARFMLEYYSACPS